MANSKELNLKINDTCSSGDFDMNLKIKSNLLNISHAELECNHSVDSNGKSSYRINSILLG